MSDITLTATKAVRWLSIPAELLDDWNIEFETVTVEQWKAELAVMQATRAVMGKATPYRDKVQLTWRIKRMLRHVPTRSFVRVKAREGKSSET